MRKYLIALVAMVTMFGCNDDSYEAESSEDIQTIETIEIVPENEIVHEGNVIIKTQKDLDDFKKGNYTYVKGSVIIDGKCGNDIGSNNFEALQKIKKIEGHLAFFKISTNVKSVVGFNELVEIQNDLIFNNNIITTIDGFNKLVKVGGCLMIRDKVSTLRGFAEFKHLGVGVNCKEVGIFDHGKNYEGKSLHVNLNSGSPRRGLSILKNIESYEGSIYVKNVADISFLEGIKRIKGDLYIQSNPCNRKIYIEDLSPLNQLETIDMNFSLDLGPEVTNLDALSNLTKVDNIRVEASNKLADISGLENLAKNMTSTSPGHGTFIITLEYRSEENHMRKITITKDLLLTEGGSTAKYLDGSMPKIEQVEVSKQLKAGDELTITFKTSSFYNLRYYIIDVTPLSGDDALEGKYFIKCSDNSLRETHCYETEMPSIEEQKAATVTYKIPTQYEGKLAMPGKYKIRLGIYDLHNYNSRNIEFEIID